MTDGPATGAGCQHARSSPASVAAGLQRAGVQLARSTARPPVPRPRASATPSSWTRPWWPPSPSVEAANCVDALAGPRGRHRQDRRRPDHQAHDAGPHRRGSRRGDPGGLPELAARPYRTRKGLPSLEGRQAFYVTGTATGHGQTLHAAQPNARRAAGVCLGGKAASRPTRPLRLRSRRRHPRHFAAGIAARGPFGSRARVLRHAAAATAPSVSGRPERSSVVPSHFVSITETTPLPVRVATASATAVFSSLFSSATPTQ